ncbi:MAG: hypothetical protein F6K21_09215 [Symploca sp. SIO2D2]|nr:hypothetical protein [Symploca sp. SIO2D2]
MSELRIALVAEGPTDFYLIQAVLKAVLPNSFVMQQLQPEATQPKLGTGWGGVLKWCYQAHQRHSGLLIDDPTLVGFDLIIIHLDVDVAHQQYSNCGEAVETWAKENSWKNLPCKQPCPPVSDTVDNLVKVIESWLGQVKLGNCTLLCLPAQSSGSWLAAAVLPLTHPLLNNAECNTTLESQLEKLKKNQRIKKSRREYRNHAPSITENWNQVKQVCTQAADFEELVLAAVSQKCSSGMAED